MTLDHARRLAQSWARGLQKTYFVLISEDLSEFRVVQAGQTLPEEGKWMIFTSYDPDGEVKG